MQHWNLTNPKLEKEHNLLRMRMVQDMTDYNLQAEGEFSKLLRNYVRNYLWYENVTRTVSLAKVIDKQ